jgi:hypothetical protein
MPTTTLTPTSDTYLSQAAPNTNYNAGALLGLDRTNLNRKIVLLRFTLPSDMTGHQISNALLTLEFGVAPAAVNCTIARSAVSWVSAQATWNIYATGKGWVGASPEAVGNYDSQNAIQDVLPGAAASWTSANLQALAQDALENRSRVLDLTIMPETGAAAQQWLVVSAEGATPPSLAVTWSTGGYSVYDQRLTAGPHPPIWSKM